MVLLRITTNCSWVVHTGWFPLHLCALCYIVNSTTVQRINKINAAWVRKGVEKYTWGCRVKCKGKSQVSDAGVDILPYDCNLARTIVAGEPLTRNPIVHEGVRWPHQCVLSSDPALQAADFLGDSGALQELCTATAQRLLGFKRRIRATGKRRREAHDAHEQLGPGASVAACMDPSLVGTPSPSHHQ